MTWADVAKSFRTYLRGPNGTGINPALITSMGIGAALGAVSESAVRGSDEGYFHATFSGAVKGALSGAAFHFLPSFFSLAKYGWGRATARVSTFSVLGGKLGQVPGVNIPGAGAASTTTASHVAPSLDPSSPPAPTPNVSSVPDPGASPSTVVQLGKAKVDKGPGGQRKKPSTRVKKKNISDPQDQVSATEALLSAGEAVVAQTGVQEAVESAANVMKFVNEAQKRAYEDITFSLSSRIRDILKGYIGVPTEVRELARSVDKAMSDLVGVGFTKEQAKAAVNEVIGGAKRTWRHEPSKISKFLRNRVSPEALDRMIMHGERLERELQGGFGYLKEHMEDTSKIPEFLLGSLKEGQRKKAAVGAFYKVLSEFGTYSREKNMYLANILKDLRVTYGLGAESSTTQNFIKDLTAVWRKRAGLSRGGIITSTETVDGLPWEPIKKAWNMEVRKPGFSESEFFDKILYKIMSSKEGVLDELVGVFENLSVDDPAEMALITDFLMDRQSYGTVLALRNNEEAMRAVYMLVEGNPIFLDDEVHLP